MRSPLAPLQVSELERALQEERAAEKAEAAPLSTQAYLLTYSSCIPATPADCLRLLTPLTTPLSLQLALAHHDDDLLTISEARSAEVSAAAAAAAARATFEYAGTSIRRAPCWRCHSLRTLASWG